MSPIQRFWRRIALNVADIALFAALFAYLGPFLGLLSPFSRVLIGLILVVQMCRILYLLAGILGLMSIQARVRGVSRGSRGNHSK